MTTEMIQPKSHARAWIIGGTAAIIAAVVAVFVIVMLVQAAHARRDTCISEKGFEGYDPVQAKILCQN